MRTAAHSTTSLIQSSNSAMPRVPSCGRVRHCTSKGACASDRWEPERATAPSQGWALVQLAAHPRPRAHTRQLITHTSTHAPTTLYVVHRCVYRWAAVALCVDERTRAPTRTIHARTEARRERRARAHARTRTHKLGAAGARLLHT